MSVRLARNPRSQSPEPAFKLAGMRTKEEVTTEQADSNNDFTLPDYCEANRTAAAIRPAFVPSLRYEQKNSACSDVQSPTE